MSERSSMVSMLAVFVVAVVGLGQPSAPPPETSEAPPQAEVQALANLLYYLLILVVVFLFGSYAVLRASRRFRNSLSTRDRSASDSSDVWAMHKAPEELEIEQEDDAPEDPGGGEGHD